MKTFVFKPIYLFYILIICSFFIGIFKYCGDSKYYKATLISSDTTYVTRTEFVDRPVYIIKIKAKMDTVIINNVPQTVATADTLLSKDSSTVKVKYYFPPLNYFSIDMNLKDKFVYKTITIKEVYTVPKTFWGRFHFGVQVGVGVGTTNKQFDLFVGYGLTVEVN
jgi:hypothetical protein